MSTQDLSVRLKKIASALGIALALSSMPIAVQASEIPVEIDYLLTTVGSSDCAFIRNGSRHDAEDAEAHLRMKYKRGKRWASTTEKFIERLASKSSFSKKPYFIQCGEQEQVPSGDWLTQRLQEYRNSAELSQAKL
jgi:hypothetical protein